MTPPADCIANYGGQLDKAGAVLESDSAVYSDVDLTNKLNELTTFNNPSLCFLGPGAPLPPTPYEPTPYATTQLIQSNILNKGAGGGGGGPPDLRCWGQPPVQPPVQPPWTRDMNPQYNILEQNRLNKGVCDSAGVSVCLCVSEGWLSIHPDL